VRPEPLHPPAGLVRELARFGGLEPDRDEWFLAGTQVDRVVRVAASDGRARLESPADGAIFAMDPDIPAARQRIVLRATGAGEGDRFVLPDGRAVPAAEPYLWDPTRGRQAVALVAADGRILDRASIDVR
jgi:penicillin-binding protein 1C